MTFKCTDLFPVAGAAGAASESARLLDVKGFLVYVGLTVLGALIGYVVKTALDLLELDKRVRKLRDKIKEFDNHKK
jgi:hypothetical protein